MKVFLIFLSLISYSYFSIGQKPFNKSYELELGISSIAFLYETNQYYYSIGYAENSAEVGVQVLCHDKSTGELCNKAYFEIEGWWIFVGGRTPVYQIGDQLIFGMDGRNTIFKLAYDLKNSTLSLLDSIQNPIHGGYYLHDMIIKGDTTIYNATVQQEDYTNMCTVIYSMPDGRKKFIYLPNLGEFDYTGGRILEKENGNLIIFGSQANADITKLNITVTEIDTAGTIIKEYKSPQSDRVWNTDDILVKNKEEVFILATGTSYDEILKKAAYTHWVYKFDLPSQKVIWRKNYGEPASNYFGGGGEICKGHNASEYLYCTTLWGQGASLDLTYLVGRVVKVREDGSKMWHKDYSYLQDLKTRSKLITMIPVDNKHYLLGGRTSTDTTICSWLVKIDEDGDIVPIDTTSATTAPIKDIPEITIYPNPAHNQIIINQGDRTDMVYTIYDAQGRMALTRAVPESHHNMVWDISWLTSGFYILSIAHKGKVLKSVQMVVE